MKILHTITSLDKGGAENHLAILSKEQKLNDDEIFIFISKNSSYWVNYLSKLGIRIYKSNFFKEKNLILKFYKFYLDIIYLVKIINSTKPDILHAHLPYMELISYISLYFTKYKPNFFITKHVDNVFFKGSDGQKKSFFGSFVARLITKKATKIIAISEAVKKFLISDLVGINKKKIKVVRYGIDNINILTRKEKNQKINKIKISKKNLVLGCIARLVPQKSIDNILKSISLIEKENIKLIIVGKGPLKFELKKLSKELNISKKIIWFDFIDDLEEFYKKIDLFVLTSKYEGLGLVFLEAMLSKKPIVCSNTSAMPEIISHNYNGFLVQPGKPSKLAEIILRLKDKKLRYKLGVNGYKKVRKEFSIKKMFLKTKKIYNLHEK
jgi:glycosyltransferase involved in cell wall biosynthesis